MNQSVKKPGVAFPKGADERNEFFEKKHEEQVRTNKAKDYQSQGRTDFGDELRQVTKRWCITAPIERYGGYRHFQ